MQEIGYVVDQAIEGEMERSYLDYAMSVIVARALPDVRDGLKPVHRRILYAMRELGLRSNGRYRKSATVVGEVLGKYHPHGDTAVYDAMVRMAQDFAMRYPLVDGQGNFGSMDGDNAAAMRYTEARMAGITDQLLADLEKDTVDFQDNYDGSHQEPTVLPAKLPNLLLNGTVGIAVGMATNIPPHNISEVIDATLYLLENPEATPVDLLDFVKGPDFPTGGILYGAEDVRQAYSTGRGRMDVRGVAEIEEVARGHRIIVTEVPYQVNKATLIEKMADLVKTKKIEGISDLRDESDRDGVRIVVELKKDAYPNKILNQLYQHTDLQKAFHLNMLALTPELEPRVMTLKDVLGHYIDHREVVVRRRAEYDLRKAEERAHVLEGLLIALDQIDAVIDTIRGSKDRTDAHANLIKRFKLTDIQAKAILDMRLSQLAALERQNIQDEYAELQKLIGELKALLASQTMIRATIGSELRELREKYGDERRTRVVETPLGKLGAVDLIPDEEVLVTLSAENYIKRLPSDTYKTQGRGGKGVIGANHKAEDIFEHMISTRNHHAILFFTNKGRVFQLPAYEIPAASRTARGTALVNVLNLTPGEKVTSLIPVADFSEGKFLFMATKAGFVKKTKIDDFTNVRASGLIAIVLNAGDELKWVRVTSGSNDVLMVTKDASAIRFSEDEVRSMGRATRGVRGMRVKAKDEIVGVEVVIEGVDLLVVTEQGIGKRTPIVNYPKHHRFGGGVKTASITAKTGKLVAARAITAETSDLLFSSSHGQVIRIAAGVVPKLSRATQGVRLMRLNDGDKLATVTIV